MPRGVPASGTRRRRTTPAVDPSNRGNESMGSMERTTPSIIGDISARLSHRSSCNVTVTRTRNVVQRAIDLSYELVRSGRLKAEHPIVTIRDEVTLIKYMRKVEAKGLWVFDLETTGLDVFNDIIVGVCLYEGGEASAYIPIGHTDINNVLIPNQLTEQQVMEIMKPYIEDNMIGMIGHNIKYDGKVVNWYWKVDPFKVNWYFDTLVGGHLLNENEKHGLKELYNKYILNGQGSSEDFHDLFGDVPFNYIPIEVASIYGGNDGYKNWKLYEFQAGFLSLQHEREDMRKLAKVMFEIEMPLTPILIQAENKGVEIRPQFAKELENTMTAEVVIAEAGLDAFANRYYDAIGANVTLDRLTDQEGKIGWGSWQQLQAFLYEVLELPAVAKKRDNDGKYVDDLGTGEEILLKLKEATSDYQIEKFIDQLLEYKGLQKLLSTYVIKIPNVLEPKTNAVHSNFNQASTVTGRFSSSHPITHMNFQNIPSHEKRVRKIFKAREGHVLIAGDYSQIEPRATASISKDPEMLRSYENNEDLYANMGATIFDTTSDDCREHHPDGTLYPEGKERRSQTKTVLLGAIYERTPEDIASEFGKPASWGRKILDTFFTKFNKIAELSQYYIHFAETYGYVCTLDGTKRRLPDMMLSNHRDYRYQKAHRQVLNAVIQGTSAFIMKKAMVRLGHNAEFRSLGAIILLTVHDEMIAEVKKENARRALELLVWAMKSVGEEVLNMPMKIDTEVTEVWYGEEVEI